MAEQLDREKSLERQIRAFHWARLLAELPSRFAGSSGEREAAERVARWAFDLGVGEVRFEAVASRPRPGLVLGIHLTAGALALALGGLTGAALALLAAVSLRRELRGGAPLLTRWLPVADSVNVVARAGSPAPTRRVVLSAHVDTAQAGWLFSSSLATLFGRLARRGVGFAGAPGPYALPVLLVDAGAVLAAASGLGADGLLVGGARLLLTIPLVFGGAVAFQWAFAPPTPGANDNASAVAAMLTCAEQLLAQLPPDTELWIVGTGAEEVGCRGMRAFLDARRDWPSDDTYFVNFECVGGGALHYLRSEATLQRTSYPPTLVELARRVAASGGFGEVTPADLIAATDGQVPAERGYPTLSLVSLEAEGVPRHYHRPDDVPESLDMPTVVRSADFAAAVVRAALRREAGPIAIL